MADVQPTAAPEQAPDALQNGDPFGLQELVDAADAIQPEDVEAAVKAENDDEEPAEEQPEDGIDEDDTDGEDVADDGEEEEDESVDEEEDEEPKRGNRAQDRIRQLNAKYKEEAERNQRLEKKLEEMEKRIANFAAGQKYLNGEEKQDEPDLDAQLIEAARLIGEDVNPEDYVYDADKKTALLTMQNTYAQKQQQQQFAQQSIKQKYAQAVQFYNEQNPDQGSALRDAYNMAVHNEAVALQRRYGISEQEAATYAEQNLLAEAQQVQQQGRDPLEHIAKYGMQLMNTFTPKQRADLQKEVKKGKVDTKRREESQRRAGRPQVDVAPRTTRQLERDKQIDAAFDDISTRF